MMKEVPPLILRLGPRTIKFYDKTFYFKWPWRVVQTPEAGFLATLPWYGRILQFILGAFRIRLTKIVTDENVRAFPGGPLVRTDFPKEWVQVQDKPNI